jgi:hypothetical protein
MFTRIKAIPGLILLLVLTTLACTIPGRASSGPAPTPTPMGDTLSFNIPAYAYNLEPGGSVPGTHLEYIGRSEGAYNVRIDGFEAVKRSGDSFFWSGVIQPGVYGNYNLRITTAVFGGLPVAGSVEIIVFYPEPVQRDTIPTVDQSLLSFTALVVDYTVPEGYQIPGTALVYDGIITQGEGEGATQLAQLSGLTGHPYLARGDSLVWIGNLRDNVVVRYNLRASALNEDGLRLDGTADLWVLPKQ